MAGIDTHDVNSLAGATYFVVGRGTEGGPSSYHLSITGVTSGTSDPNWGHANKIIADSGYSLGTIQVDLGKRGTWALGATDGAALKPGETTYVDGIIDQSSKYAKDHGLAYTNDTAKLRANLLTHGNGEHGRTTLNFIDKDTRDGINAWAGSQEGQQWIHKNIDYPQIKNATQSAMDTLDKYGKNIPEDRRLETVAILAKTENQIPSQMKKFEKVLQDGGNYDDVLAKANQIKETYSYYDGPKAAALAEQYKNAYKDPAKAAALDRASTKVGDANFDPSKAGNDPDVKEALKAIGQGGRAHAAAGHGSLKDGSHGEKVTTLQTDLAKLGFTDAHGRALHPDGDFGPGTKAAVEKFQRAHGLTADGVAGPKTLEAVQKAAHPPQASLADAGHPGNAIYKQALEGVKAIDAKHGRTPDHLSNNFAASLATEARNAGLTKIDHVVMSDDGKRAYAMQGESSSPFKRVAEVDVAQSVAKPIEQSSAEYAKVDQQQAVPQPQVPQPQQTQQTQQPSMHP
ncbi:MAG TPA: peptidoglycan-binding domain-containing protein [Luteibacter sp.]|uniref:peptidoglycan-binding domain-containing protein n=1 Tax=Luteibacter sp. TaxID=1886636 RepID=UPI002D1AB488|nr:peptidoglycan-binding domain-containing protein [Luteibacter sp.]HVI55846.1 peptidoglycan-binding domain-containing protein [Luteibacter sp.]